VAQQTGKRGEDGAAIGGGTAETAAERDVFFDVDADAGWETEVRENGAGGAGGDVLAGNRDGAGYFDGRHGGWGNFNIQPIAQVNGLEDGGDVMIAVRAFPENL
jgi:hypothetical protein